jgi:hypothetical protein
LQSEELASGGAQCLVDRAAAVDDLSHEAIVQEEGGKKKEEKGIGGVRRRR